MSALITSVPKRFESASQPSSDTRRLRLAIKIRIPMSATSLACPLLTKPMRQTTLPRLEDLGRLKGADLPQRPILKKAAVGNAATGSSQIGHYRQLPA